MTVLTALKDDYPKSAAYHEPTNRIIVTVHVIDDLAELTPAQLRDYERRGREACGLEVVVVVTHEELPVLA